MNTAVYLVVRSYYKAEAEIIVLFIFLKDCSLKCCLYSKIWRKPVGGRLCHLKYNVWIRWHVWLVSEITQLGGCGMYGCNSFGIFNWGTWGCRWDDHQELLTAVTGPYTRGSFYYSWWFWLYAYLKLPRKTEGRSRRGWKDRDGWRHHQLDCHEFE